MKNVINNIATDLQESMPDLAFFICRSVPKQINIFFALADVKEFDAMNDTQKRELGVTVAKRVNFSSGNLLGNTEVKLFLVREAALCFSHFVTTNVDEPTDNKIQ